MDKCHTRGKIPPVVKTDQRESFTCGRLDQRESFPSHISIHLSMYSSTNYGQLHKTTSKPDFIVDNFLKAGSRGKLGRLCTAKPRGFQGLVGQSRFPSWFKIDSCGSIPLIRGISLVVHLAPERF